MSGMMYEMDIQGSRGLPRRRVRSNAGIRRSERMERTEGNEPDFAQTDRMAEHRREPVWKEALKEELMEIEREIEEIEPILPPVSCRGCVFLNLRSGIPYCPFAHCLRDMRTILVAAEGWA